MVRYECPCCGNTSAEGLAIGKGPECCGCGTEMVRVCDDEGPDADRFLENGRARGARHARGGNRTKSRAARNVI